MDNQKKLRLGCAIYLGFGILITILYFAFGSGDLFRSYFEWSDIFDLF